MPEESSKELEIRRDGTGVTWQVKLKPFRLPNFLHFDWPVSSAESDLPKINVGELSEQQALAYWEWMKDSWLLHVRRRRELLEQERRNFGLRRIRAKQYDEMFHKK
jgi:hypothetical protein